jgi:hypothetical protein
LAKSVAEYSYGYLEGGATGVSSKNADGTGAGGARASKENGLEIMAAFKKIAVNIKMNTGSLVKGAKYEAQYAPIFIGTYNGKQGDSHIFIDNKGAVTKYTDEDIESGHITLNRVENGPNATYYRNNKAPGLKILGSANVNKMFPGPNTRKNSKKVPRTNYFRGFFGKKNTAKKGQNKNNSKNERVVFNPLRAK